MKQRATTTVAVVGAVLMLATACGQARAGTALPKGDDAASYISAKFQNAMNQLQRTIGAQRDTTASSDAYFRIDDKWLHSIVTSARLGSPEARISRNRSQKNPDESLESFTPAGGKVNYLHLGPVYKSLAPTSWVSMPKPETGNAPICSWGGVMPACKMADAVALAVNADKKAVKSARSFPDGRVELAADITLDNFLAARVEVLPQSALSQLSDAIRQEIIPTKITLVRDGTLGQLSMEAKISKDNHNVELRYDYKFTGKATAQDFPKTPDPADVTPLPDQPAVDDFYRRLGDLQGS
jgi:hypothetical protein